MSARVAAAAAEAAGGRPAPQESASSKASKIAQSLCRGYASRRLQHRIDHSVTLTVRLPSRLRRSTITKLRSWRRCPRLRAARMTPWRRRRRTLRPLLLPLSLHYRCASAWAPFPVSHPHCHRHAAVALTTAGCCIQQVAPAKKTAVITALQAAEIAKKKQARTASITSSARSDCPTQCRALPETRALHGDRDSESGTF